MRLLLGLALLLPSPAVADVSVAGAVGAGAQGAATYGAVDLRLDVSWTDGRLGLGARGVWDDAVFRTSDWSHVADLITLVRDFEVTRDVRGARLALAAGMLAPAQVGRLVDGYRATLDDRFRTGARAGALHDHLELGIEIDDVLDPALVAGGARWAMSPPWSVYLSLASDPSAPSATGTHVATALEAGVGRRLETDRGRVDAGVSVIAELSLGASVVGFASAVARAGGVRWTARADVRAGTGTGSRFGPLYRIERLAHRTRLALWDRAQMGELDGAGAGISVAGAIPVGWLELGVRSRPGLGGLATAAAGAPMGRLVQAGAWAAVGRDDAAGAAEVRVAWANTLFSALQVARIYRLDAMDPFALWSVTAWFGAASE